MDSIKEKRLTISEIFYSVQGEGPQTGVPAYFIRLAGCNLLCGGHGTDKDGQLHNGATWRCDTIEVWQKGRAMYDSEIMLELNDLKYKRRRHDSNVVFTGGEPMLQQEQVARLIERLTYALKPNLPFIEVETNGTILATEYMLDRVNQWNISLKLSNSGTRLHDRRKTDVIQEFAKRRNVAWKFVAGDQQSFTELENIVNDYGIDSKQVWIMPPAETRNELNSVSEAVIDYCKVMGFRFSNRLHIQVWNKKTGV